MVTTKEMTEIFSVMLLAWPNAEMFKGGVAKLGPTIELWTACLSDVDFWLGQQAVIMPVKIQSEGEEQQYRAAEVYLMRLPDGSAAKKKAPYIIHQAITSKDTQPSGELEAGAAVVRSIFAVYNDDEQEGGLMLLNLMERLRIRLLREVVIGRRFQLDLESGLETFIYPDDTAPYYAGEMTTTWRVPGVEREVRQWL